VLVQFFLSVCFKSGKTHYKRLKTSGFHSKIELKGKIESLFSKENPKKIEHLAEKSLYLSL